MLIHPARACRWRAPELQHGVAAGNTRATVDCAVIEDNGAAGSGAVDEEPSGEEGAVASLSSPEAADMFAAGLLLFHTLSGGQHVFEMPHRLVKPNPTALLAAAQRLQLAYLLLHPRLGRRPAALLGGTPALSRRIRSCVAAAAGAAIPARVPAGGPTLPDGLGGSAGEDERYVVWKAGRLEDLARQRQARIDDWFLRWHASPVEAQQTMQARLLDRLQWHTHWQCSRCRCLNRYANPNTFDGEAFDTKLPAEPKVRLQQQGAAECTAHATHRCTHAHAQRPQVCSSHVRRTLAVLGVLSLPVRCLSLSCCCPFADFS